MVQCKAQSNSLDVMEESLTYLRYAVGLGVLFGIVWLIWRDSAEQAQWDRDAAEKKRLEREQASRMLVEDQLAVESALSRVPNYREAFDLLLDRFNQWEVLNATGYGQVEMALLQEISCLDPGERIVLDNLQARVLTPKERELLREAREVAGDHWRQDFAWQGPDTYLSRPTADTLRNLEAERLVIIRGSVKPDARTFRCELTSKGAATLSVATSFGLFGSPSDGTCVKRPLPVASYLQINRLFHLAIDAELPSTSTSTQTR